MTDEAGSSNDRVVSGWVTKNAKQDEDDVRVGLHRHLSRDVSRSFLSSRLHNVQAVR